MEIASNSLYKFAFASTAYVDRVSCTSSLALQLSVSDSEVQSFETDAVTMQVAIAYRTLNGATINYNKA